MRDDDVSRSETLLLVVMYEERHNMVCGVVFDLTEVQGQELAPSWQIAALGLFNEECSLSIQP